MPRLVGKQSNTGAYTSLLLVLAIAAAVGLEYAGIVNFVPGFGKPTELTGNSQSRSNPY